MRVRFAWAEWYTERQILNRDICHCLKSRIAPADDHGWRSNICAQKLQRLTSWRQTPLMRWQSLMIIHPSLGGILVAFRPVSSAGAFSAASYLKDVSTVVRKRGTRYVLLLTKHGSSSFTTRKTECKVRYLMIEICLDRKACIWLINMIVCWKHSMAKLTQIIYWHISTILVTDIKLICMLRWTTHHCWMSYNSYSRWMKGNDEMITKWTGRHYANQAVEASHRKLHLSNIVSRRGR